MSRTLRLEIKETVEELHQLLRQQKTASGKERIQALYLLKTEQVETVQHLAVLLGRGRITVQRWLKLYRDGGLSSLLEQKKSPGRPKIIPEAVRSQLKQELQNSQGFNSYEEVRTWLKAGMGITASYKVVHETVRYKLKTNLKAPHPRSAKQQEGREDRT